jgi:hypothetical protein
LRRLWSLWRLRLVLALWGLRSLCGVRWMCASLVGCRAAASNVCLSAAGQAADAAAKAAAQRRKPPRNALHEIGVAAECGVQYAGHKIGATAEYGVQYAGPIARSPGDASAGDQTRPAVFAPGGRAGIDPRLKEAETLVEGDQSPARIISLEDLDTKPGPSEMVEREIAKRLDKDLLDGGQRSSYRPRVIPEPDIGFEEADFA